MSGKLLLVLQCPFSPSVIKIWNGPYFPLYLPALLWMGMTMWLLTHQWNVWNDGCNFQVLPTCFKQGSCRLFISVPLPFHWKRMATWTNSRDLQMEATEYSTSWILGWLQGAEPPAHFYLNLEKLIFRHFFICQLLSGTLIQTPNKEWHLVSIKKQ